MSRYLRHGPLTPRVLKNSEMLWFDDDSNHAKRAKENQDGGTNQ